MEITTLELRRNLREKLDLAQAGEEFSITRHGTKVARLMPVAEDLAAAGRRAAESLDRLSMIMEQAKARAFLDDPGLEAAIGRARAMDPAVGWLDVATHREKAREATP